MSSNQESGPSSARPNPPKAIGSLAKKPEVTRQGAQKLVFVPTLPVRRKKETEVKSEKANATPSTELSRSHGQGKGTTDPRGRGRGRGMAPRPPPVDMIASGPFALGPSNSGTSARRLAPLSNFTPNVASGTASAGALGAGLSRAAGPSLKRQKAHDAVKLEQPEEEVYSDPDEGVEIVDMVNVRHMDWMAPEGLQKERIRKKRKSKTLTDKKIKDEASDMTNAMKVDDSQDVNTSNALNLSESEEEEEFEDIIDDFTMEDVPQDPDLQQERLFFFQFPSPFPKFEPKNAVSKTEQSTTGDTVKKVAFAPDTKPPAGESTKTETATSEKAPDPKVDGIIGQLEIYRSGAVKMRLGDGILMDVTAATQPSFLQHAVHVDLAEKKLCVLGEVNKRFVVSPDIDCLLDAMEVADQEEKVVVESEVT